LLTLADPAAAAHHRGGGARQVSGVVVVEGCVDGGALESLCRLGCRQVRACPGNIAAWQQSWFWSQKQSRSR
jgi:hypothetical protein